MGAEFNFSGARPSAIAAYINSDKCKKADRFVCMPKLRGDTFTKIADDRGYSLFSIKSKKYTANESAFKGSDGAYR